MPSANDKSVVAATVTAGRRSRLSRLPDLPYRDWRPEETLDAAFMMLASRWHSQEAVANVGWPIAMQFLRSRRSARAGPRVRPTPLTQEERRKADNLLASSRHRGRLVFKADANLLMRAAVLHFMKASWPATPISHRPRLGLIADVILDRMLTCTTAKEISAAHDAADDFAWRLAAALRKPAARPKVGRPKDADGFNGYWQEAEDRLRTVAGGTGAATTEVARLICWWMQGRVEQPPPNWMPDPSRLNAVRVRVSRSRSKRSS